jgi:hypothetical protein
MKRGRTFRSPIGTLSFAEADGGSGIASLNFTTAPNTALLLTGQKAKYPSLFGNQTSEIHLHRLHTEQLSGLFKYFGEPSCGVPAPGWRAYGQLPVLFPGQQCR